MMLSPVSKVMESQREEGRRRRKEAGMHLKQEPTHLRVVGKMYGFL